MNLAILMACRTGTAVQTRFEKYLGSATTLHEPSPFPFCHPVVVTSLILHKARCRGDVGLSTSLPPQQSPQQRPCPLSTVLSFQQPSPFCHPDRSEAQGRDLRCAIRVPRPIRPTTSTKSSTEPSWKHHAADPSASLPMTKSKWVFPGNWFEGSQVSNARPGAPIGFTLRFCKGHKLCHFSPDSLQRVGCSRGTPGQAG
jgi:hypothetical protein